MLPLVAAGPAAQPMPAWPGRTQHGRHSQAGPQQPASMTPGNSAWTADSASQQARQPLLRCAGHTACWLTPPAPARPAALLGLGRPQRSCQPAAAARRQLTCVARLPAWRSVQTASQPMVRLGAPTQLPCCSAAAAAAHFGKQPTREPGVAARKHHAPAQERRKAGRRYHRQLNGRFGHYPHRKGKHSKMQAKMLPPRPTLLRCAAAAFQPSGNMLKQA